MSKERAKSRIEAEFSDRSEIPDASGSKSIDVRIPNSGLDIDDVQEIDYVNDVLEEEDEFRVYVSADSNVGVWTT
ncbi:hypothetical protein [Halogeometricum borinquense]|uniref:hypothetical protein n=1 Tax=Halogeometricum borinquense TaxID=60847 RepID=UPI0006779A45|nr:hypothetical protein [Halogeometricum borinquense]